MVFFSYYLVSLTWWAKSTGFDLICCKLFGLLLIFVCFNRYWISLVLLVLETIVYRCKFEVEALFSLEGSSNLIPLLALYYSKTLGILISIFFNYFWSILISGTMMRCSLQIIGKLDNSLLISEVITPTSYSNLP